MINRMSAVFMALLAMVFAFAAPAQAAIDTSAVTASITDGAGAVTTVGVAALGVVVLIAVYKWIRRAL